LLSLFIRTCSTANLIFFTERTLFLDKTLKITNQKVFIAKFERSCMIRNLIQKVALAFAIMTAGCARERESSASIFYPIYAGKEDDAFQREIYHSAKDKKPISPQTLGKMNSFFANRAGATEDRVEQYAEAQREVYSRILQRESAEKLEELSIIFRLRNIGETTNYHAQLPPLLNRLKTAHRSLDPAYKRLDETYQSIAEKLIENN